MSDGGNDRVVNQSQFASAPQMEPSAYAGDTAPPKRRGYLFTLLLCLPALFWLVFLVLLPGWQPYFSSEQRAFIVIGDMLVGTITILALTSMVQRGHVLSTLPLWTGILVITFIFCRSPYYTVVDYGLRYASPEEKESSSTLLELGAHMLPDGVGHIGWVAFDNLQMPDDRLRALKALPRLKSLIMKGPGVTDAVLANLQDAHMLQCLMLTKTQVSDAGLEHLHGLHQLQDLHLDTCPVTAVGVQRLQQALPHCKIVWESAGGTGVPPVPF